MTDDYKKGFVTGLAMQPLCVSEGRAEAGENLCCSCVIPGIVSEDCACRLITFEEE